jgi:hypothetical protein
MIGVTLVYGASLNWLPKKAEGKPVREQHDIEEEN